MAALPKNQAVSGNLKSSNQDCFLKYLFFFFLEKPLYNFLGGSICSSNRHVFSRRVNLPVEQILTLQEALLFHQTHKFSKSLYFLKEQTSIFQEALSDHKTHRIFQEALCHRTGIFHEGTSVKRIFQK